MSRQIIEAIKESLSTCLSAENVDYLDRQVEALCAAYEQEIKKFKPVAIWGIDDGGETTDENWIESSDKKCFNESQVDVFYKVKG